MPGWGADYAESARAVWRGQAGPRSGRRVGAAAKLLRSYLGKAFSETGNYDKAAKEFDLARQLDPNDPTSWLYSALLLRQENRVNEAIQNLEKSQDLNENRRIYRSRLLLDQDRAVRGANLATLYADAGLKM